MAKDYQRQWQDITDTIDEAKAVRILAEILVEKEGRTFISSLERKDAELCIEILDHGIVEHNLRSTEKQAFFVTLRRLSARYGRLPYSMIITARIEVSDEIFASGGFADIRRGTYMGHLVAVKTLRVPEQDDILKIRKQFCKEVVLWNTLSHPNVLKPVGVLGDMEKGQFSTVSEWMAHGNIMEYSKNNYTNRLELLHGAAQGLKYLHGACLTHGDLKGANILMSSDTPPRACLADFGFMTVVLDPVQPMSCSAQLEGGTLTFMSPELLMPSMFGMKDSLPTPEGDIYAFGLVTFQVLTGEIPFRSVRQTELGWSVTQGLRPNKPENAASIGFSDLLWGFVQRCWDADAKLRPNVMEVVTHLGEAAANWNGFMPPCVEVENVPSGPKEPASDSVEHLGIFGWSSSVTADSGLFDGSSTRGELQGVITEPSREPNNNPHAATPSHLNKHREPASSQLPQKKRRGFKYYVKSKLPGTSSRPSTKPSVQYTENIEANDAASASREGGGSIRSGESELFTLPIFRSPGELVASPNHPPLNVVEIITESRRRPNQDLVDRIDAILDDVVCDRDRRELLNALCKMCSLQRTIPKSMHMDNCLNEDLTEDDDEGCPNMFRGKHKGRPVGVKIVHLYLTGDFGKYFSEFCREAVAWRHLQHPNILPLLGVNLEGRQLAMISEWMDHGNINKYVENHEGVNRVQLLVDAANGLEHMHNLDMAHGGLKGANILINKSFRACLADFSLSTIVGVERHTAANASLISVASDVQSLMSFTAGGSIRWMSPELLDPDQSGITDRRPTKESDCYALGMVVYEVLCGNAPYWEFTDESEVVNAIMNGGRPPKPEAAESLGFTKGLWGIVERCWSTDASARPGVGTILSHLNHATRFWERRRLM